MDNYPELEKRDLPEAPSWKKALGVGVVVMGLAIGTGELIMWPHLIVKYGLNLLWLALIGISAQYFINQEVARNALATGEGFFTASSRVFKWFAIFWLILAPLLYIWPGWASSIGTILKELFGFGNYLIWAWLTLGLALVLTFSGKVAYEVLERTLKITVPTFFVMLLIISFGNISLPVLKQAFSGLMSFGSIPKGIDMNVLLSAVVFSGAGGMLNLCVSLWYRDKQMGMAKYVGRIKNPITGEYEAVEPLGYTFEINEPNLKKWKSWMNYVRIDQGVIFWLLGFITLFLLSVNAFAVLVPLGIVPEGLQVAVTQANIFGERWGVFGFKLFLVMAFLMLFSVMWTVIDALARIISDILHTNSRTGPFKQYLTWIKDFSLSHFYYFTISSIILIGAVLIPLEQPLTLLVISAVFGGLTMAIYTPFLIYLNNFRLPKELRPGIITNIAMVLISIFFMYFAVRIIDLHLF
ncbi:MAG: Nramp family divalent metal transporter [Minisyncoccota bacterium]